MVFEAKPTINDTVTHFIALMPWQLGTSSRLQMIAVDLVIAKLPFFATVMTFDG